MPVYDICCEAGHVSEVFIPLTEFNRPIFCTCNAPARRLISAPMFAVDNTGYSCPITGKWISSKREHLDNLRRHDCRVLETGEHEAAAARRRADDEALERAVDATVERTVEELPSAKKEQLYAEITRGGLDVEVARQSV